MQAPEPYRRPALLFNKHIETIYPAIVRRVPFIAPSYQRIPTPDSDFLDLEWYEHQSKKLVIISHGLEGNSQRAYVRGMARAFVSHGFDALTWNYRGCGNEMNRQPRFYHSGATDDLDGVVQHAIRQQQYEFICLVGFSLGGNLTLKYLGEPYASKSSIHKAVAISVPLDLDSSCTALSTVANKMYVNRFLRSLKKKVSTKAQIMSLPIETNLTKINTLRQFDDVVTAPLHGFRDASDYYAKNSSINFLSDIKSPTLIINALNDPFLSPACYPKSNNPNIKTLWPRHGGHVGFTSFNKNGLYWSELQALNFCHY